MILDFNSEDGVCGVDYAEWRAEAYDDCGVGEDWYDDEQDGEWVDD